MVWAALEGGVAGPAAGLADFYLVAGVFLISLLFISPLAGGAGCAVGAGGLLLAADRRCRRAGTARGAFRRFRASPGMPSHPARHGGTGAAQGRSGCVLPVPCRCPVAKARAGQPPPAAENADRGATGRRTMPGVAVPAVSWSDLGAWSAGVGCWEVGGSLVGFRWRGCVAGVRLRWSRCCFR